MLKLFYFPASPLPVSSKLLHSLLKLTHIQLRLSIPEPCHERWDAMTPTAKGAFCQACSKEVIDFSGYSTTELITYFSNYAGGGMCGRFKNSQLGNYTIEVNPRLLYWQLPLWKKLLAVILICFGNVLFNEGNAQGQNVSTVQVVTAAKPGTKKSSQPKQKRKKKRHITKKLCMDDITSGLYTVTLGYIYPEKEIPDVPSMNIPKWAETRNVLAGNGDSIQLAAADGPGTPVPPQEAPPPEKQAALVAGAGWMRLWRNTGLKKAKNKAQISNDNNS